MFRRGAVHGIAGRLARLENRETADGRMFPDVAAETGQDRPPLVIGPEMPGDAAK